MTERALGLAEIIYPQLSIRVGCDKGIVVYSRLIITFGN